MTISSKLFATQMLDQFKAIENRLQTLNTQIATGSRIVKSSDEPLDAVNLTARTELKSRIEQYQSNVDKVNDRLGLADASLETIGNLVTRMNEKFIATNTATVTDAERQAVRVEVLTFKDSLLGLANSVDNNGDALYGGFSTENTPFVTDENGQVIYRGDGGEHTLQVSESVKLPTSLNGSTLFMEVQDGERSKSSFDVLDSFANALLTDSQFEQAYTAVSEATETKLRIKASREPQNWAMQITGPLGTAIVSADINSNSFAALVKEINESGTGLEATENDDGTLSVSKTDFTSEAEVIFGSIAIEGYDLAQQDPKYYIDVLDENNDVKIKLSDESQALAQQGTPIQALVEHFALSRTIVGARINNADAQNNVLQDRNVSVQTDISKLRDADIETLITELQTIMVTRDAARQTYSTINSQSLFDFLK
jgi:flagellar hook-associated protein 3 FlgL